MTEEVQKKGVGYPFGDGWKYSRDFLGVSWRGLTVGVLKRRDEVALVVMTGGSVAPEEDYIQFMFKNSEEFRTYERDFKEPFISKYGTFDAECALRLLLGVMQKQEEED